MLIISGKDRAKTGKVLKSLPKFGRVVVEGVNIVKKSQRPRQQGQKGQIVSFSKPIDVSNVKLLCSKCGKPTRVGYRAMEGEKTGQTKSVRVCKKCSAEI